MIDLIEPYRDAASRPVEVRVRVGYEHYAKQLVRFVLERELADDVTMWLAATPFLKGERVKTGDAGYAVVLRTTEDRMGAIVEGVRSLHADARPEIVAVPVLAVWSTRANG
ncbi:divalent cation tolerance protein CutA [Actinomadura rugatobispora]|uniref:Divalent cation tolerance protein CutA n=1 Tax=Actinomadura rugatobispora TaxID=1994 RepID=A0ABW1A7Q4_9ACTN|nr:hypothetical protein GCM10010200_026310 [Actinomadura rugatobispora]